MTFRKENTENDPHDSYVNEPQSDYEKAELDLIRNALKRTHTERFEVLMSLIKTNIMLKKAKITHQTDNLSK